MKICASCKNEKPLAEFYRHRGTGYQSWCKNCSYSKRKTWLETEQGREAKRWNRIWTKYRLRKSDYEKMLVKQNNRCKICLKEFTDTPHVDHNHSTGAVRGLLCGKCNHSLGVIEAALPDLDVFMKYLEISVDTTKGLSWVSGK